MKKTIVGCIERVVVGGKRFKARIDTGARISSLDSRIAKRLGLGPIVRKTKVKSANGKTERPVIRTLVKIKNRKIKASFSLVDRSEMEYGVLIGRNILRNGFHIDVSQ